MISRKLRYAIFVICIGFMVMGNIIVHILSINLSEQSLKFEKEVSTLKEASIKLESQIAKQSSLQSVAACAIANGYKNGGTAVRWMAPIVAVR